MRLHCETLLTINRSNFSWRGHISSASRLGMQRRAARRDEIEGQQARWKRSRRQNHRERHRGRAVREERLGRERQGAGELNSWALPRGCGVPCSVWSTQCQASTLSDAPRDETFRSDRPIRRQRARHVTSGRTQRRNGKTFQLTEEEPTTANFWNSAVY